jgi:hypothetical protein
MFAHLVARRESEASRACFRRVRRGRATTGWLAFAWPLVLAFAGCEARTPAKAPPTATDPVDTDGEEVALAVAPDGALVAAWIGPGGSIEVARSRDGATFDESIALAAPGRKSCDPAIAIARDGTIEVAWLGVDEEGVEAFFASGALRDLPQHVAQIGDHPRGAELDKTSIAITHDGTTLVSYLEEQSKGEAAIVVGRRAANGSFTETRVSQYSAVALPALCASPDADRTWIAYLAGTTSLDLVARVTDDDGSTWSTARVVLEMDRGVEDDSTTMLPASVPSCVAAGRVVWVLEGVHHVPTSALFAMSFQEPNTLSSDSLYLARDEADDDFDPAVRVDDPDAGDFMLDPAIAREPSGALDLVYYAGKDGDDTHGALRWMRWTGSGSPKSTPLVPILYHVERTDDEWLGDYMGAAVVGGAASGESALVVAYADNRSGRSHVGLERVRLPKSLPKS